MLTVAAKTAGADAWGYLFGKPSGPGPVLAIYRRSLLWLAAPDRPLTLAADSGVRGPLTVEVAAPADWLHVVAPGMEVQADGNSLRVGPSLTVDLSQMILHDPPLASLTFQQATALAHALAGALPTGEGLAGWAEAALPHKVSLETGLRQSLADVAAAGVKGLVGLGPGLTPSGDDFLAGVLAALQSLGPACAADAALLSASLAAELGRTTLVARRMLFWAMQGRYGESVRSVFEAASRSESSLAAPIAGLLATGATSGADTAAGIRFGLSLELERVLRVPGT